jgi:hypothetical protein
MSDTAQSHSLYRTFQEHIIVQQKFVPTVGGVDGREQ